MKIVPLIIAVALAVLALFISASGVDKLKIIPLNQYIQSARTITYGYSVFYEDYEESIYSLYEGLDRFGPIPEFYLHLAYAYSHIEIPDAAQEYLDSFYVACADTNIPEEYRDHCPSQSGRIEDTTEYIQIRTAWSGSKVYNLEEKWSRRWEWDVYVYLLASDAMADEMLYPQNPCAAIFLLREATERYGPIPEAFWLLSVYYTYLGFLDSALQSTDFAIASCNDTTIDEMYREPCYEYENFAVRSQIYREIILWEISRTDFELK